MANNNADSDCRQRTVRLRNMVIRSESADYIGFFVARSDHPDAVPKTASLGHGRWSTYGQPAVAAAIGVYGLLRGIRHVSFGGESPKSKISWIYYVQDNRWALSQSSRERISQLHAKLPWLRWESQSARRIVVEVALLFCILELVFCQSNLGDDSQ